MDSFIFAINAVLPIILMVAVGYAIKRIGIITKDFAKAANKLVFRLFLPTMLFMNIYNIEAIGNVRLGFVFYTLAVILLIFFVSIPLTALITKDAASRGAVLQSTFRSNFALIGIPLADALFPVEGAPVAAILSAFTVPLLNMLAVISLSLFKKQEGSASRIKAILLDITKNPLIVAVASGVAVLGLRAILSKIGVSFRLSDITPLYKAASTLGSVATPLALVVLGAQFEFTAVKRKAKEILFGTSVRLILSPLLGLGIAAVFLRNTFSGAQFAAMSAAFLTPVSVSSVPMAQEMNSDTELAGQLVVWTTLASALTVFLGAYILSAVGIFPT